MAIVETPQGSRNKFAFDPACWLFRLSAVLPQGASFPHAFGFVPSTLGEDGDPLDVMVLMDEPVYPGCLVPSRLIGVIRARQTDNDGTVMENDRLLAVSVDSHRHSQVERLGDLPSDFITEIEHFFEFYNQARGKIFEVRAWKGARAALKCVKQGQKRSGRHKKV